MTGAIALLLPVPSAEPAPQPAAAEDPARFAAALVAALQTAMVVPPAVPHGAALPAEAAPQEEAGGASQDGSDGSSDATRAQSPARGPAFAGVEGAAVSAGSTEAAPSADLAIQTPKVSGRSNAVPPQGVDTPDRAGNAPTAATPHSAAARERGQGIGQDESSKDSPESFAAAGASPPHPAPATASPPPEPGPTAAQPGEAPAERGEPQASGARSALGADRTRAAGKGDRIDAAVAASTLAAIIPVPLPTAPVIRTEARGAQRTVAYAADEPAAPAVSPAGTSSGDAAAAGAHATPALEAGGGIAFAQELATLFGDAEVTDLRVSIGRRPLVEVRADAARPSAVEQSPSPEVVRVIRGASELTAILSPSPAPQLPASPARETAGGVIAVADGDRVEGASAGIPSLGNSVAGPRDPAVVVQRASVPIARGQTIRAATEEEGSQSTRRRADQETVRVRVAQPAPQRSAPLALPLEDARPAGETRLSRAPNLPASRQELPPSAVPAGAGARTARAAASLDTAAPSDSRDRASTLAPAPGELPGRAATQAKESPGGEARNMPDRGDTPDRPAGLADRVTLQIADGDGGHTRIRVTVLGDQVRAVLLPSDQAAAQHLERRMDDLQAALVRQGFTDARVSVQSPPPASTTAAPWGAAPGNTRSEHASGRGMEQPAEDRGQGSGRQQQDRQGDGQRHPQQRFRGRDRDDRQNQDA